VTGILPRVTSFLITSMVIGIKAQRLVRTLCIRCQRRFGKCSWESPFLRGVKGTLLAIFLLTPFVELIFYFHATPSQT
jgi:hypothetical protein